MAKAEVFVPDGDFCSDKYHSSCLYLEQCGDIHKCVLYNTLLKPIETFKTESESIRAFRKCNECRDKRTNDLGNGF